MSYPREFEKAVTGLLEDEGGYVHDLRDPGGETKYGISKRSYPDLDIKNLTIDQAKAIYYRDYWQSLRLSEVPHRRIQAELLDSAVLCGPFFAATALQRSLHILDEQVKVDGRIGAETLAATRRICDKSPKALFICLNGYQFMRFDAICADHPDQRRFARGWITRRVQQWQEGW